MQQMRRLKSIHWRRFVASVLLASVMTVPVAAEDRLPTPNREELDRAAPLVRDTFAQLYQSNGDGRQGQQISEMLHQAAGDQEPPAVRYALLSEAAQLATDAGQLSLAFDAVARLGAWFEDRALEARQELLPPLVRAVQSPRDHARLAEAWVALSRDAIALAQPDIAAHAARRAVPAARNAPGSALADQARLYVGRANALQQLQQRYEAAEARLTDDPEHAVAHLHRGRYLAFVLGDWDEGLASLSRAGDRALGDVVAQELESRSAPESLGRDAAFALGEAWQQLGEREGDAFLKMAYFQRSNTWYRRAVEHAEGTMRRRIENRIAENQTQIDPEPVPATPAPPPRFAAQARQVDLPADREDALAMGRLRQGTVIQLQYVDGQWKAWGRLPSENPDAQEQERDDQARLVIADFSDPTEPSEVLAVVPPNTRTRPFAYTLERTVDNVVLRIHNGDRRDFDSNPGEVTYRLLVTPP